MVHHYRLLEQQVEPVCITVLGGTQIPVHRILGIRKTELAGRLIISIDKFVHLSVHSVFAAPEGLGEIEESLVGHFLVDTHLILGIHHIIVPVGRLETHSELSGIIDSGCTRTSFLGRDDNHTCHRLCSVY